MKPETNAVFRAIVGYPRTVLLAAALLTAALAFPAAKLEVDSSVDGLLPRDDPGRAEFERARERFGSDELGIVAVIADDVFAPAVLAQIDRLTRDLAVLPGIKSASSLTTYRDVEADPIEPPLLVPSGKPIDAAAIRAPCSSRSRS